MCILIFFTIFTWNISHSKKNPAKYRHKCENAFMQSTRYSCRIVMKVEFSGQIFEKAQTSSFITICVVGIELFQVDGQTVMTKLVIAFRNFAKALEIFILIHRGEKYWAPGCQDYQIFYVST